MFEESWIYRIIVILSLCILLVWTYLTNEDTLLNYIGGKFILDTRLIWQIGIFALLSVVLFYLMQSTLDYKAQGDVLKKYMQRMQAELDNSREAMKRLKSETNEELMRLESFVITISDMSKQISSVLETEELLRLLLRKAIDLLEPEGCAIFKVDGNKNSLIYVDSVGYDKRLLKGLDLKADEESGQIGLAAKTGIFTSKKIISQDPGKKHIMANDKFGISYSQPIVHNFKTLAVICVSNINRDLIPQRVARFMSMIANFGAVALANTELVDKMREQSVRDSLTWLYNHQYFQGKLNDFLKGASKERKPIGLIIMDLDHFKQLNDTYGHQAGDFVLKNTAGTLVSSLAAGDIVARYGGEEFAVILPDKGRKESLDIAERLRSSIEKSSLNFEGNDLKVTCSIGLSVFDPAGKEEVSRAGLIKYADQALYAAKEQGRNRVVLHGDKMGSKAKGV